jgi:hypothetical protein
VEPLRHPAARSPPLDTLALGRLSASLGVAAVLLVIPALIVLGMVGYATNKPNLHWVAAAPGLLAVFLGAVCLVLHATGSAERGRREAVFGALTGVVSLGFLLLVVRF